jgi:hypothetical protein
MTTNFADIADPTLQKLADAITLCIFRNGSAPAAGPNSFTDKYGTAVTTTVSTEHPQAGTGSEVMIIIKINPGGTSAVAKVESKSPKGVYTIGGTLDIATVASKLA